MYSLISFVNNIYNLMYTHTHLYARMHLYTPVGMDARVLAHTPHTHTYIF